MTALSLVWPSPATVWKSLSFGGLLQEQRPDLGHGIRGVIYDRLALMSSGFRMFLSAIPSPTSGWSAAGRRWQRPARPYGCAHRSGHVDIAEIRGLGNGLRGRPSRGLPGFQIDALRGIDALGLAVELSTPMSLQNRIHFIVSFLYLTFFARHCRSDGTKSLRSQ
jgi:hypothetical protein